MSHWHECCRTASHTTQRDLCCRGQAYAAVINDRQLGCMKASLATQRSNVILARHCCLAPCCGQRYKRDKLACTPGRCSRLCPQALSQDASSADDSDFKALQDWRSFRAQLVALEKANSALQQELADTQHAPAADQNWVHELTLPEKGCLLLGRMKNLGVFTKSVVLLCHHDQLGSTGYMINAQLQKQLVDLSTKYQLDNELQQQTLMWGGPCSQSTADALHTCEAVPGASEIVKGLYHGGLEHVNTMARLGKLHPHQAQLVIGCAGWDPGQLAAEVQAGCWVVLAASDQILKACVFGEEGKRHAVNRHLIWQRLLAAAGIDVDSLK